MYSESWTTKESGAKSENASSWEVQASVAKGGSDIAYYRQHCDWSLHSRIKIDRELKTITVSCVNTGKPRFILWRCQFLWKRFNPVVQQMWIEHKRQYFWNNLLIPFEFSWCWQQRKQPRMSESVSPLQPSLSFYFHISFSITLLPCISPPPLNPFPLLCIHLSIPLWF